MVHEEGQEQGEPHHEVRGRKPTIIVLLWRLLALLMSSLQVQQ